MSTHTKNVLRKKKGRKRSIILVAGVFDVLFCIFQIVGSEVMTSAVRKKVT